MGHCSAELVCICSQASPKKAQSALLPTPRVRRAATCMADARSHAPTKVQHMGWLGLLVDTAHTGAVADNMNNEKSERLMKLDKMGTIHWIHYGTRNKIIVFLAQ